MTFQEYLLTYHRKFEIGTTLLAAFFLFTSVASIILVFWYVWWWKSFIVSVALWLLTNLIYKAIATEIYKEYYQKYHK